MIPGRRGFLDRFTTTFNGEAALLTLSPNDNPPAGAGHTEGFTHVSLPQFSR